jgi:RNA polymerase sigma factor (sigma-70 family)
MQIHLSERDQEILQLKYFEEKNYKEISAVLNMNEAAVRKAANRAEKKLKALVL